MSKSKILKFTTLQLAITAFSLIWVNVAVMAQQNEQIVSAQEKTEVKTKSKEKSKTVKVPLPTPISQLHKEDLKHYLPANKVQPLLAGPDDYITLVTESSNANNKGVFILLPDWQQGATNPKAINFLRKELPLQGWTTISIQPTSKPDNYPSKALKVSKQKQENKTILDDYKLKLTSMINAVMTKANEYPGLVIIVAQGNHGAMLVELLHQENDQSAVTKPPNALILLSSYLLSSDNLLDEDNTNFAQKLAYSEYPVLDLFLRFDHPITLDKAQQRRSLSQQEMKVYYRQRKLNNIAMGYYPEQKLMTQINSWLKAIGW